MMKKKKLSLRCKLAEVAQKDGQNSRLWRLFKKKETSALNQYNEQSEKAQKASMKKELFV